jgi:sugar lactone lactonase YvrE
MNSLHRKTYRLLAAFVLAISAFMISTAAWGVLLGPDEVPPGGVTVSQTGTPNDGSWGRIGGKTWFYSNVVHADRSDTVYWGLQTEGVRLSLDGNDYSGLGEVLDFDPAGSNLVGGRVEWAGQTLMDSHVIYTRLIMTVTEHQTSAAVALTLATSEGLPADVGALVPVPDSAFAFDVNLLFVASYSQFGGYEPYLDLYDRDHTGVGGEAFSSVYYGFYYENTPPFLLANIIESVSEGGTVVLSDENLTVGDYESDNDAITLTIDPDSSGAVPHNGGLWLDSMLMVSGDSFTMADITAGRVSYRHDGSETTEDNFAFNVRDEHGGLAVDGVHSVFSHAFDVQPVNDPPTAINDSGTSDLDGTFSGILSAQDPDSTSLTFSITDVDIGMAHLTDSQLGSFDYTSPLAFIGDATIRFQVYDGQDYAETEGQFVVTVVDPAIGRLDRGDLLIADGDRLVLHNLPDNSEYLLTSGDQLDTVIAVTNSGADGIFLLDRFNGLLRVDPVTGQQILIAAGANFSPDTPGSIAVEDDGHVLVAEVQSGLLRVDVQTGVVTSLSSGGLLPLATAVAVDADGRIYVADASAFVGGTSAIVEVDPLTGAQTVVSSGPPLGVPFGMTTEADGRILVADQIGNVVIRIDPSDGSQSVLAEGGLIADSLTDVTASPDGGICVATESAGVVVDIDPVTGSQTLILTGSLVTAPSDVSVFIPDELLFRDSFEDLIR